MLSKADITNYTTQNDTTLRYVTITLFTTFENIIVLRKKSICTDFFRSCLLPFK